ncbi:hypothetical protein ACUL08_005301, partial [Escherichia coli]
QVIATWLSARPDQHLSLHFQPNSCKSPSVWLHLRFDGCILTKPIRRKSIKYRQEMIERRLFFKKKAYFKLFKVGFCFTQFQRVI